MLKTVFKNSLSILCVKISMPLSYFAVTLSVARILGVNNFGVLALIFTYYAIFRIISVFGIDSYLIREIAKDKEKAGLYLGNAFILGISLSLASILLMNAVFVFAGYSLDVRLNGLVVSLLLVADNLNKYLESSFIALQKSKYILFSVLITEPLKIAFAIAAMLISKKLIVVTLVLLASCILALVIKLAYLKYISVKPKFSFDRGIIKDILGTSFLLAIIGGLSSIFLATDVIVLSKIRGEFAVGLYSAAYKFVTLAFLFTDSIGMALLPFLASAYKNSAVLFKKISETTFKYFVILGFIFAVPIFFFSKEAVLFVFGRQFLASSAILNILVWASVLLSGSYFYGKILFTANLQKYDFFALLIGCIANLLLNIYFTIKWGYIGTAAATTVSAVLLFGAHFYFFYNKLFAFNILRIWFKPLLAGAVFFLAFFYSRSINLFFGLIFSGAIYALFLVIFKVVNKEELTALTGRLLRGFNYAQENN